MLSQSKYSSGRGEAFGLPFFITLDASQAQDLSTIAGLITRQYERILLTQSVDSLWFDTISRPASPPPRSPSPVDMFQPSGTSPADPVVEIRVEGTTGGSNSPQTIASSPVPETATDESPSLASSITLDYSTGDELMSAKDEVAPSPASFRRPIFNLEPFSESSTAQYGTARTIPSGKFSRGGSQPFAYSQSPLEDQSGEDREPLLKRGDGILCSWPTEAVGPIFGSDRDEAFATGFEKFSDPSAPKPDAGSRGGKNKKTVISIEDCLDEFSKEEELSNDDLW